MVIKGWFCCTIMCDSSIGGPALSWAFIIIIYFKFHQQLQNYLYLTAENYYKYNNALYDMISYPNNVLWNF